MCIRDSRTPVYYGNTRYGNNGGYYGNSGYGNKSNYGRETYYPQQRRSTVGSIFRVILGGGRTSSHYRRRHR